MGRESGGQESGIKIEEDRSESGHQESGIKTEDRAAESGYQEPEIKMEKTDRICFNQKRVGLTEKRAREYGLRVEAFFCLDFLVTFLSRKK